MCGGQASSGAEATLHMAESDAAAQCIEMVPQQQPRRGAAALRRIATDAATPCHDDSHSADADGSADSDATAATHV
jgi:hypothetical protein